MIVSIESRKRETEDETIEALHDMLVPNTEVIQQAEQALDALAERQDHIFVLAHIATHRLDVIGSAALSRLTALVRVRAFSDDEIPGFLGAVVEMFAAFRDLPSLKHFSTILSMRMIREGCASDFVLFVLALFQSTPKAALLFTNSVFKVIGISRSGTGFFDLFTQFSGAVMPFLAESLTARDADIIGLALQSLSRAVAVHFPAILHEDTALRQSVMAGSFAWLGSQNLPAVEYSLRFWARLIRAGLEDVLPAVPQAALAIGLAQASVLSVSYSL
jgi:hypothetical protein